MSQKWRPSRLILAKTVEQRLDAIISLHGGGAPRRLPSPRRECPGQLELATESETSG